MKVNLKINMYKDFKSIKKCKFELPAFSLITGKNGSGKTHLLEAIGDHTISEVEYNGKVIRDMRLIRYNSLNVTLKKSCSIQKINEKIDFYWEIFNKTLDKHPIVSKETFLGELSTEIDIYGLNLIKKILDTTDIEYKNIVKRDLESNFDPYFALDNDFFSSDLAFIFKEYHRKYTTNKFDLFLENEGNISDFSALKEEEFKEKYGTPPWIYFSEILEIIGLPYKIKEPIGMRLEDEFSLKLINKDDCKEINIDDLSTGEKALMTLGLAMYNLDNNLKKPGLIIIDEPDAGLHPSMSKKMIEILHGKIVKEAEIPVIISTHSATTVIASEGVSIYELKKGKNVPEIVSQEEAIETLTCGIPFLKITNNKNIPVFVESFYDVINYNNLANKFIMKETIYKTPCFLAVKDSSDCTQVKEIVNKLGDIGFKEFYGIIDRDKKSKSNGNILVLGEGERYAIENFILDPLSIGLLLIRIDSKMINKLFQGISFNCYADAKEMSKNDAQIIIDKILMELNFTKNEKVSYKLENGWELEIEDEFNNIQGHELESRYKQTFSELKRFQNTNGLIEEVIKTIMNDFPKFIVKSLLDTIKKIV